jgi:RNA polymerase sigma-70 factor (ECF subfamily)
MADPSESPEEAAVRSDIREALKHCLGELPPDFRSVVILVDVQGLDYAEAAQAIGKPLGTVKSRLARARVRLRDCLSGFGELLPAAFRLVKESKP